MSSTFSSVLSFILQGTAWIIGLSALLAGMLTAGLYIGRPISRSVTQYVERSVPCQRTGHTSDDGDASGAKKPFEPLDAEHIDPQDDPASPDYQRYRRVPAPVVGKVLSVALLGYLWLGAGLYISVLRPEAKKGWSGWGQSEVVEGLMWGAVAAVGLFAVLNGMVMGARMGMGLRMGAR